MIVTQLLTAKQELVSKNKEIKMLKGQLVQSYMHQSIQIGWQSQSPECFPKKAASSSLSHPGKSLEEPLAKKQMISSHTKASTAPAISSTWIPST